MMEKETLECSSHLDHSLREKGTCSSAAAFGHQVCTATGATRCKDTGSWMTLRPVPSLPQRTSSMGPCVCLVGAAWSGLPFSADGGRHAVAEGGGVARAGAAHQG